MIERQELIDEQYDILTHRGRKNTIYVLTLDPILGVDVTARIASDERLKGFEVIRPSAHTIGDTVDTMERAAQDTTHARLLIFDVRRAGLPKLRKVHRDIVGFNRKDFNKLCFSILIGDGPPMLYQNGRGLDAFTIYLGAHRVDYHPAVFFYDPLLHYEPSEAQLGAIDDEFKLRDDVPRRLAPYFRKDDMMVDAVRRYFRAVDKPDEIRQKRRRMLKGLYRKQINERLPGHEEQIKAWMSRKGLQLATEKINLYPMHFEDWVYRLMRKAQHNAAELDAKAS